MEEDIFYLFRKKVLIRGKFFRDLSLIGKSITRI